MRLLLAVVLCLSAVARCAAAENELSTEERAAGWRLLFDGRSTAGWMTTGGEPAPPRHVQDGCLNPHPCDYMLVWGEPVGDCELALDFRLSAGCNSGVFVRTWPLEPRPGRDVGSNGIEIAIDDTAGDGYHDTGAIYDLVRPRINAARPAAWNRLMVECRGPVIAVTVNGERVARMDCDEWVAPFLRPDGSRHKFDVAYKDHPRRGFIGLQDHGRDCWYRSIKLRPLPDGSAAP